MDVQHKKVLSIHKRQSLIIAVDMKDLFSMSVVYFSILGKGIKSTTYVMNNKCVFVVFFSLLGLDCETLTSHLLLPFVSGKLEVCLRLLLY